MTGRVVGEGALYYASSRRRRIVAITPELRAAVVGTAQAVREMLSSGSLPAPTADVRRCRGCSLRERCQPEALARLRSADAAGLLFDPEA